MAFYKCGGGGQEPTGNAEPQHVLAGKTFSNNSGIDKLGTMPNASGDIVIKTGLEASQATIPYGYHDGQSRHVDVRMQEYSYQSLRDQPVSDSYANKKLASTISIAPLWEYNGGSAADIGPYPVISKRSDSLDLYSGNGIRYPDGIAPNNREIIEHINTNSIPNSNSGTYTIPYGNYGTGSSTMTGSSPIGGAGSYSSPTFTYEMGETNSYLKVNGKKLYYTGYDDGARQLIGKGSNYYNASSDPVASAKNTWTCDNYNITSALIYITGSDDLGDNYDSGNGKISVSGGTTGAIEHTITYTAGSGIVKLAIIRHIEYGSKITIAAHSLRVSYRIIFEGKADTTYYSGMG